MKKYVLWAAICFASVCQAEQSKRPTTIIPRDTQGYPYINSAKEACDVYPKTVQEVQNRSALAREEIKKLIAEIVACPVEKQNKETVLRAFDRIYAWMDSTRYPINAVGSVHPDELLRNECITQFVALNIFFIEYVESNKALYKVFKQYHDTNAKTEQLSPAERYFLETIITNFERAGLALSDRKSVQLLKLKKRCMELEAQFQKNLNDDVSTLLVSKEQLAGMSEEWIAALPRQGERYVLVATEHYYPILTHCSLEGTREAFYRVYSKRAYPANAVITSELLKLRNKRARLLGYSSFAEYDLDTQMVRTPEKATAFLEDVLTHLQQLDETSASKIDQKRAWWNLWYQALSSEQGKKVHEMKPWEYFTLEQTLSGLIKIYEQFFDVVIEKIPAEDAWHQDVQLLRISTKDKKVLQYLFLDLFTREKKMPYGRILWTVDGIRKSDKVAYPAVATVVCNFSRPYGGDPAFLAYDDVSTLFHELGHAMHSAFARTSLCYQAGIKNVVHDLLEVPSKLMEYWLGEREIAKMISCHYKTGKPLQDAEVDILVKDAPCKAPNWPVSDSYWAGFLLELHDARKKKDVEQINKKWRDKVYPHRDRGSEYHDYCSLNHLAREEYGPKMYSYVWCHVLATDIFSRIEEEGILNPKEGKRYVDAILCHGASKDPNEMLRDYLGREPRPDAFYKKMGLA